MKKILVLVTLVLIVGFFIVFTNSANSCDRKGKILGENPIGISICDLPECFPGEAGGVAVQPCFSSNPDEVKYWD